MTSIYPWFSFFSISFHAQVNSLNEMVSFSEVPPGSCEKRAATFTGVEMGSVETLVCDSIDRLVFFCYEKLSKA